MFTVVHLHAVAAARYSSIYLCGQWLVLEDEDVVTTYFFNLPVSFLLVVRLFRKYPGKIPFLSHLGKMKMGSRVLE